MTISWPLSRQQVLDPNGKPYLSPRARFFAGSTTTPLVVYADPDYGQPHPDTIVGDANGRFPRVYMKPGLYAELVMAPDGAELWRDDNLGEAVVDVVDPDPPVVLLPAQYFSTGDVKWRCDSLPIPGWVRMNGHTLGNAISGASERADADCKALYLYLWSTFPDTVFGVVGGRGGSAQADFDAGKQIVLPDMRGAAAVGLDDMGNGAAGRIAAFATITLTSGSVTATVDDASRIASGMQIFAANVPTGTTVVQVVGSTVTMSAPAGVGAGTTGARFGAIDSQQPGSFGGTALTAISNANLPVNLPGATVTIPGHQYQYVKYLTLAAAAGGTDQRNLWKDLDNGVIQTEPEQLIVEQQNPGGGRPLSTLPPARVGTFFMKL